VTKPVVVKGEHGRKFTLIVPKPAVVEKVRIDDGAIKGNQTKKCDWAIKINPATLDYVFFIELKGSALDQAIKQLECTIIELKEFHHGYKNKQAHAVCSKILPAFNSSAQVAIANFSRKHGFILKWHSQYAEVRI
jgi:hypothetical protein